MDPMEHIFGNTLVVQSKRGNAHLWYEPDGTFTGRDDRGQRLSGTWTIDGERLCTKVMLPVPRPDHRGRMESHKPGDSWEDHRDDGTTSLLRIEAGRPADYQAV